MSLESSLYSTNASKELNPDQLRHIDLAACTLHRLGLNKVQVEAGHFYIQDEITDEHHFSLEIGARLTNKLQSLGVLVETVMFIDDFHTEKDRLTLERDENRTRIIEQGLRALRRKDYVFDKIYRERDSAEEAEKIIERLVKEERAYRKKGFIRLVPTHSSALSKESKKDGVVIETGSREPSCALLDALNYMRRFQDSDEGMLVTIMPLSYKAQQNDAKAILKTLGQEIPILNIFIRPDNSLELGELEI